ncbi:hypothetical protein K439DRAFT_588983 [Ramaria rubella]|nr:hypothetical protein K439DRAFT_588983 [Ramaria rubella]
MSRQKDTLLADRASHHVDLSTKAKGCNSSIQKHNAFSKMDSPVFSNFNTPHGHCGRRPSSMLLTRLNGVDETSSPTISSPETFSNSSDAHYVPASSTPDLLSPNVSSYVSSPHVPFVHATFTARLHTLLQALLDAQCEQSPENPVSQNSSDDPGWITVPEDDYYSKNMIKQDADAGTAIKFEDLESDGRSSIMSNNNFHVWTPTAPDNALTMSYMGYHKTQLTHQNKRKHDNSSAENSCSGESSARNTKGQTAKRKKLRSDTSSSSWLSHQTASYRKLKTLGSVTSSSSGTSSASKGLNTPHCFSHPIIHPPAELPLVPKTISEIAKCRIQALLRREKLYRIQDGLPAGSFEPSDLTENEKQYIFGIEVEFRQEVVQWIFDVILASCSSAFFVSLNAHSFCFQGFTS